MAETETRVYWLHALTGVHIGAGVGVGAVDLPIAREKVTEWPYIPGSSFKGVLAAHHDASDEGARRAPGTPARAAFGSADNDMDNGNNSGALMFTDARLICLPVASFFGTFAWITCSLALRRLSRDLQAAGIRNLPAVPAGTQATVALGTVLTESAQKGQVFLGDLDFAVTNSKDAAAWATYLAKYIFPGDTAWGEEFQKRFIVLPDDEFTHFARYACEVVPRIKIDGDTRTVKGGALWLEEMLPTESILAGIVVCDQIYQKSTKFTPPQLVQQYCGKSSLLQFGGKATVGRGRVQVHFSGREAK